MKNNMLKKTMVFGIIVLFVGASVVSAINSKVESADVINEIGNLNRGTETFNPTDDTQVYHLGPNSNYGSHESFTTQNEYGAGGSPGWASDGLIRFDISSIPPDTEIESAVLSSYYHDWDITNPVGRNINLYRVTSDWDEMSVTWNTQPSYAPQPTTYSTVPSSYGWMEWDVTSDVQDFIFGNKIDYGWKITDDTYWGKPNIPQTRWRAKEYGNYIAYLEIEIIENQPPQAPQINGQTSGKAGQSYSYTFVSVDPDDDDIFYQIDWGDGNVDPWDGPYESNEIITKDHIWSEQGDYSIRARAKDVYGEIGDWGTLEVTMPMNQQSHNWWFLQFLQNHPRIFPLVRHLLGFD